MKFFSTLAIAFMLLCNLASHSQTNSEPKTYTHRDSLKLAKLNSSANLMIAGGVGLCGAGGYLLYQGIAVYRTRDNSGKQSAQSQNEQNKKQGIIYLAAAGVGMAAGIVLTAFGARNKVEFKRRKKEMAMDIGILQSGQLGVAMIF